jgi:GT2 family glycosyltransferase/glycosyltransferase involved in cell wall biosynthesis/SAM-dependent methyltransferase
MKSKLEAEYSLNSSANYWLRQQASEFGYSDGEEVEQRLLDVIEKAQDLRSGTLELRAHITDWPTRYHLSPLRSNLLRPFQHVLKGSILEVGAGCGAITRFLGECGGNVLALEGSAFRAKIAASRCRDLKNVTVVADAFHQFRALSGFDVVTLIGVVEYARKYFICNSGDPVDAMLAHARDLLRPGGILIVAIENQLGLKYFAGFPEDHAGVPMHGIEDQYRRDSVVTFGQAELRRRLSGAGFHEQKWWFPFPDYKLPVSILSEDFVEGCLDVDFTPLLANAVSLDSQRPATFLFSLEKAWEPVSRNQLTGKLANSFLILASDRSLSQLPTDELGYHYALERRPEFAKRVVFLRKPDEKIWVRQVPLFPEATSHEKLPLTIHFEDEAFVRGEHWQHRLIRILNTPNWVVADLETWASTWFKALIEKAGLVHTSGSLSAFHALPGSLFDAIPRNMILRADDHPYFIDQEWRLELPVELGFVVFRGVALALLSVGSVAQPARGTPTQIVELICRVAQSLGIWITEPDVARYASFEKDIQSWATGTGSWLTPEQLMTHRLPVRSPAADRDAAMKQRDAAIAERDGQIAALNHLLEERERFAQKALADKERELSQEIVQRESEREWIKQDFARTTALLRSIEHSLAWLLITEFRRVRDMSFPEGTLRRRTYNSVKTFLKNCLRSRARETLLITGGMEATRSLPYADGSVSTESARHQRAGGVVRIDEAPQDRLVLEAALMSGLNLFLSSSNSTIVFPQFQEPRVSIVIPTFNKAEYLYQCLGSVFAHTEVPYEVIVVDDFSQDVTPLLRQKIKNIKWVRNPNNLGFLRTANRGASLARGGYVLFLNNDVVVTPQWLSALLRTMEAYPGCGAVGAKLVRTDGTLQEAGSIIWQDGSVSGYGRGDNPWKPEYCYVREVDYCSAACLLVRRDLFEKLRGFDERYVPSYYEDSDLCFALWQAGYKTVLQAQVAVLHHEFVSHSHVGAQHAMEVNQPKFAEKWKQDLSQQHPCGKTLLARDRRRGKRVLVLDDQVPAPHLGSGFPRAYKMLELLAELDCVVTFLPVSDPTAHQPTTGRLQELGVEVLCGEKLVCEDLLRIRSGHYDVVLISRPHNGSRFLSLVRKCFPTALIVYDAEAIFCFRQFLKAEIEGRPINENEKQAMLREELSVMSGADVVITVSELEREAILKEKAHDNVVVWQHPHELCKTATPFSERRDLLFVGGFLGGHPPNTDAVRYFVSSIFPKILRLIPDCRLFIVGSQPPESVKELASEHVVVTGFVERLEEYYGKCRVFVVPIRFMAGVSLKLIEAMSYGIPSVVSSVAASGLNLRDGREALIAADDEEFVNKVLRIYENETLWHAVQSAAQDYIRDHCSPAVMKDNLARILAPTQDVCFKRLDKYG